MDTINGDLALVSDEKEWMNRLRGVAAGDRARQAGTIFNGCSAVDVADPVINGVIVLDPTPIALRLLKAAADSGLYPGTGSR